MSGPVALASTQRVVPHGRQGYTLVEILTATALTLLMMSGVVVVLGNVSTTISNSRSGLEMMDRTRAAQQTLRRDLQWATAPMLSMWTHQRGSEAGKGYFEYIEGPRGQLPATSALPRPVNSENGNSDDTTVGDFDDILMFTARSPGAPFIGRYGSTSLQCADAEIAWFVRGRTLYRRVLLVPSDDILNALDTDGDDDIDTNDSTLNASFFDEYDLSAHPAAYGGGETSWVPNSLADLARRENRFAHCLHYQERLAGANYGFPFDSRRWRQLGLPTLGECSHPDWMRWANVAAAPVPASDGSDDATEIDLWVSPHPWAGVNPVTGTMTTFEGDRVGEDVILTNVIGFDVKAWDPSAPVLPAVDDPGTPGDLTDDTLATSGAAVVPGDPGYRLALNHLGDALVPNAISFGAYVDLDYRNIGTVDGSLGGNAHAKSGLHSGRGRVYDTWSFHYENDGINQDSDSLTDEGTDGFDNDSVGDPGYGVVDDVDERETSPPYPYPLRGIQVKIRVFEPDGKQVREVTVVQDFMPK